MTEKTEDIIPRLAPLQKALWSVNLRRFSQNHLGSFHEQSFQMASILARNHLALCEVVPTLLFELERLRRNDDRPRFVS